MRKGFDLFDELTSDPAFATSAWLLESYGRKAVREFAGDNAVALEERELHILTSPILWWKADDVRDMKKAMGFGEKMQDAVRRGSCEQEEKVHTYVNYAVGGEPLGEVYGRDGPDLPSIYHEPLKTLPAILFCSNSACVRAHCMMPPPAVAVSPFTTVLFICLILIWTPRLTLLRLAGQPWVPETAKKGTSCLLANLIFGRMDFTSQRVGRKLRHTGPAYRFLNILFSCDFDCCYKLRFNSRCASSNRQLLPLFLTRGQCHNGAARQPRPQLPREAATERALLRFRSGELRPWQELFRDSRAESLQQENALKQEA